MNIRLETITDCTRQDVLAIRREDVSEDAVDSIPAILALTQYGLDHGCLGHTYAIYAEEACVGIILMGEGIPWDCDPPEVAGIPFYRIMGFVLDREYRSRGIGGQVLEQVIKAIFAEYGPRPILLGVQVDNEGAARFYRRHGFIPTEAMDEDDRFYIRYPDCPAFSRKEPPMQRAIVIGCPGSGKSTFARALQSLTGLPLHHLDMLYWNADRTTVEKEVFRARLAEVIAKDRWIIDGNYASTMPWRMQHCDTVFFLDYPLEVCLAGVEGRRGQARPDMPWVETGTDEEFLDFIRAYREESRPAVLELLAQHPEKDVHIFRSREEAGAYLAYLRTPTSTDETEASL